MAAYLLGVVKDALSAHRGVAFCRWDEAGDYLHQRRLAGTIGAKETHYLSRLDAETDVIQRLLLAIQLGYILYLKHKKSGNVLVVSSTYTVILVFFLQFAGFLEADTLAVVEGDDEGIFEAFLAHLALDTLGTRDGGLVAHSVTIDLALLV